MILYFDPLHALADDSTPEARAAACELVRELTRCLYVAEQRQARHGAVHLELKGQLLAGTQVSFVRKGQQLSVEITPGCEQAQRLVSGQLEVLRELLVSAAPDCDVSLLLAGFP